MRIDEKPKSTQNLHLFTLISIWILTRIKYDPKKAAHTHTHTYTSKRTETAEPQSDREQSRESERERITFQS